MEEQIVNELSANIIFMQMILKIIGAAVGLLVMYLTWVTVTIFNMKSDIRANTQDDQATKEFYMTLESKFEEKMNDVAKDVKEIREALLKKGIIE